MQLETMYSEVNGQVATLMLNRPQVLNCANEQWARDLNTLVEDLAADTRIRVVVLRGAGKAFCSGIDLKALSEGQTGIRFFRNWEMALRRFETMDPIVISAIQSHCIGGGLQMALASDLRIARDDARFGITAVREGIVPGIGMWRVARYAGLGRAKRLALTAEVVGAEAALEWGLVDWVVSAEGFEAKIAEVTSQILSMAATSTRLTKKLTNMALETSFADFMEMYMEFQQQATTSPDHLEAMAERRTGTKK